MIFYVLLVLLVVLFGVNLVSKRYVWASIVCVVLITILTPLAVFSLRGTPLDMQHEWIKRDVDEAKVFAFKVVPNKFVYLLLSFPEEIHPRYYILDWEDGGKELARQLLSQLGEGNGDPVILKPFNNTRGVKVNEQAEGKTEQPKEESYDPGLELEFVPDIPGYSN